MDETAEKLHTPETQQPVRVEHKDILYACMRLFDLGYTSTPLPDTVQLVDGIRGEEMGWWEFLATYTYSKNRVWIEVGFSGLHSYVAGIVLWQPTPKEYQSAPGKTVGRIVSLSGDAIPPTARFFPERPLKDVFSDSGEKVGLGDKKPFPTISGYPYPITVSVPTDIENLDAPKVLRELRNEATRRGLSQDILSHRYSLWFIPGTPGKIVADSRFPNSPQLPKGE